jgi:hypothetical protein
MWSFTSKKELVGAFMNIITNIHISVEYGTKQTFMAHRTLCHKHRILHRDVSKNIW